MSLTTRIARFFRFGWLRTQGARTLGWEGHFHAARTAYQEGRLPEAEREFAAALRDAEWFPPGDMRVVVSLSSLAGLYRFSGRTREAEPLCLRALALKERSLGPDHPDVAASLGDLVDVYRAQGKTAQADACYRRALAILEEAIGGDLPELSESLEKSGIAGKSRNDDPSTSF